MNGVDDYRKLSGSLITDTTIEAIMGILGLKGDINECFKEAFESGENRNIDLTVEDIYGSEIEKIGLIPKDVIASSMGKC